MVWSKEMERFFIITKSVMFCVLFLFIILLCAYSDTHYKRTGWIQTTSNNGVFEFVDSTGNIWEFADSELIIPFGKPIEATARMFTNNTTDFIKDDIILDYEFMNMK